VFGKAAFQVSGNTGVDAVVGTLEKIDEIHIMTTDLLAQICCSFEAKIAAYSV
jgi:hypothetical protein